MGNGYKNVKPHRMCCQHITEDVTSNIHTYTDIIHDVIKAVVHSVGTFHTHELVGTCTVVRYENEQH